MRRHRSRSDGVVVTGVVDVIVVVDLVVVVDVVVVDVKCIKAGS